MQMRHPPSQLQADVKWVSHEYADEWAGPAGISPLHTLPPLMTAENGRVFHPVAGVGMASIHAMT